MTSARKEIMSEEKSKKMEEILGFEDESNALSVASLHAIEEKLVEEVQEAVASNVRHRMKIGDLLNEARIQHSNDGDFGKWRAKFATEHMPGVAPRTLEAYQQMSREFKNAPEFVEKVGFSVARELINASPAVMNQVHAKLEAGEKPTVAETRAIKEPTPSTSTEEKDVTPPPVTQPSAEDKKPGKVKTVELPKPDELANVAIEIFDHEERMEYLVDVDLNDYIKAYAFLGLEAPETTHAKWVTDSIIASIRATMPSKAMNKFIDRVEEIVVKGAV